MALRIYEELKKFFFVAFSKVLLDTLPIFQTLNRFFLLEDTDLSSSKPIISATMVSLQIQKNINGRNFQHFLNDLIEHPCEHHQSVQSRFFYKGVELANCSKMDMKKFEHFNKSFLEGIQHHLQDRFPNQSLEVLVCENSEMHELFPDFAILATVALVMPFGSALREKINGGRELLKLCQWSFSKEDQGLSSIMKIALNGPVLKEFDFALAVEYDESK
uniref:Uncharacterized protein n=1 Tax=Sphaerodactylus townsendi TaxID=933632 RepID=A0ACB8EU00_9SAUR